MTALQDSVADLRHNLPQQALRPAIQQAAHSQIKSIIFTQEYSKHQKFLGKKMINILFINLLLTR